MSWLWLRLKRAGERPLFWWNLVLLAAVVFFTFIAPAPNGGDFRVRTLGVLLQLIGLLTVWLDLTSTARQFGKGGFLRSTFKWLGTVFLTTREATIALSTQSLGAMTGRVRAKARTPINPNAPPDERFANLELLTREIDNALDGAYKEIDRRADELDEKLKDEAKRREGEINAVKKSLESAATGNYAMLAFGAAWLAIGVVLATLAPEIAKLVNGQWCEVWRTI